MQWPWRGRGKHAAQVRELQRQVSENQQAIAELRALAAVRGQPAAPQDMPPPPLILAEQNPRPGGQAVRVTDRAGGEHILVTGPGYDAAKSWARINSPQRRRMAS